jgi:cytochrome b
MALRDTRGGIRLAMPVWDGPTRLFHWSLALVFAASCITAWRDQPDAHLLAGYLLVVLLLFRLIWGIVGSDTARFSRFLRGPGEVLRELGRISERTPDTRVGHGPLGGWLAVLVLLLLAGQAASGLAGRATGEPWLRGLHRDGADLLLGVVGLHLLVIIAYAALRGHDLVRPMITGKKRLPAATPAPGVTSPFLALAILALAAGAVWLLAARL